MMRGKKQKGNIFITAAVTFALLLFLGGMLLVSAFYQEIYGFPRTINGNMDFEGYSRDTYIAGYMMQGEWEFFANQWIVTDETEAEPDAMIRLPGVWTGFEADGKSLSKTGYASYRATVTNLNAGEVINVVLYKSPVACRIFINGQLNSESGRSSKDPSTQGGGELVLK